MSDVRLSWYAVPVSNLVHLRTDWTVVIAADIDRAIVNVRSELVNMDDYVSGDAVVRWLGPAHEEDVALYRGPI